MTETTRTGTAGTGTTGTGTHRAAPPAGPPGPGAARRSRAWDLVAPYAGVGSVLVALCVLLAVTQPQFATAANLVNILETNAVTLVLAVGLTFVLLTGGFDLSVGGVLALTGVVLADLIGRGWPAPAAVLAVVAGAALLGLAVNGLLVARVGLSFFVVTIGTASVFRGLAQLSTGGQSVPLYDSDFLVALGSGRVAGIPWAVLVAGVVFVVALLVARYTGYGRMVYAVGGNAEAARLAGLPVAGVRASVYAIAAGLAGLAGVLLAGRLASASPAAGAGIELTVAAAVLLGGTSFAGGSGTLLGTLLGVLFLGVLSNGLTLAGISAFWQGVVSGAVLLLAVLLDRLRARRAPS
jgi:ribose transport system permease protein